MKLSIGLDKVLAGLFVALLFVAYIHQDYTKWSALGRDAFLNYEGARFDRYISHPHWGINIFASIIVIGMTLIVYELLSTALGKLINNR